MCFSTTLKLTLKLSLNRRSSIKNWLSWVLGSDTTFFCCNSGRSRGSVDVKYLALTHIFTIVCMRVRSTLFLSLCIFFSTPHTHFFRWFFSGCIDHWTGRRERWIGLHNSQSSLVVAQMKIIKVRVWRKKRL